MTTTMPTVAPRRGDVVLVLFPNSDLRTAKPRPALVVQAKGLETGLPQVIIAMITSKTFRASHPCRVFIRLETDAGRNSGLLADSVVMADNLTTILISALDRKIGFLPMEPVNKALSLVLGLNHSASGARSSL